MAFTKEDQEALAIQSKRLEDIAADVAASEGVKEITSSIDRRVKLAVYVVGDALIGFGLLTPNIAIVAGWHDLQAIVALSSALGTGGAFLLTMFGIYKNGK